MSHLDAVVKYYGNTVEEVDKDNDARKVCHLKDRNTDKGLLPIRVAFNSRKFDSELKTSKERDMVVMIDPPAPQ